jgi:plastocyanin
MTLKALLVASLLTGAAGFHGGRLASADGQTVLRGRVEITNSKVKLRDGSVDASGVAVWLLPRAPLPKPENSTLPRGRIEQRDKRFIPHVTIVQVGTEIDFPNKDPFFHNVFSTFDGKTFDLGLYASGESKPVRFNRPGISYLYCNIHPQMGAVIVTVDTPYFALSGTDGSFSIRNLPSGDYEVHVWHERSDPSQLNCLKRMISISPPDADLGVLRLDEASYMPAAHKNKHGEDYPGEHETPAYRRP